MIEDSYSCIWRLKTFFFPTKAPDFFEKIAKVGVLRRLLVVFKSKLSNFCHTFETVFIQQYTHRHTQKGGVGGGNILSCMLENWTTLFFSFFLFFLLCKDTVFIRKVCHCGHFEIQFTELTKENSQWLTWQSINLNFRCITFRGQWINDLTYSHFKSMFSNFTQFRLKISTNYFKKCSHHLWRFKSNLKNSNYFRALSTILIKIFTVKDLRKVGYIVFHERNCILEGWFLKATIFHHWPKGSAFKQVIGKFWIQLQKALVA